MSQSMPLCHGEHWRLRALCPPRALCLHRALCPHRALGWNCGRRLRRVRWMHRWHLTPACMVWCAAKRSSGLYIKCDI